jgi:hypothetical protein
MNLIIERLVPARLCGALSEELQKICDHYKPHRGRNCCLLVLGGKCLSQSANKEYEKQKHGDDELYGG